MYNELISHIVFVPLLPLYSTQTLSKDQKPHSLCFHGERMTWLQPDSLDEFLNLKWKHPDARVVVGNTEVGQSGSLRSFIHSFISQLALIYSDKY